MAHGLAERHALVDVGNDVVEHRLRGSDRQGTPGEPGAMDALRVDVAVSVAEQRAARDVDAVERQAGCRGGTQPHGGLRAGGDAAGATLDHEQCGSPAVELGGDHEQLGLGAPRDERLHTVEGVPAARRRGAGLQAQRIEGGARLEDGERRRRQVFARQLGQVGRLLVGVAP